MNLSFLEKVGIVLKHIFSSYLSIEMFIISLLLFFILFINIKRDNFIIQLISISIYMGFVIGIFVTYTSYVRTSINSFVKGIMNYIYFPSTIVYFFIMLFVSIMLIYTLFSKKLTYAKKVVNYAFFSLLFFFFMSFLSLSAVDGVDLINITKLYQNDTILSLVQISNLLLLVWFIITGFYHLYHFYKKKYDQ
jgi:hypothetical protein